MKVLDRRALFASGAAAALLAATGGAFAQTPRRGGALRIAIPRDGALLAQVAYGSVLDQLTEIGPDGILRPELALRWNSEDGARIWTFDLREDAIFHSGQALTVQDVTASLLRHFEAGVLQDVSSLGQNRVRVTLHEDNPQFPFLLAQSACWITPQGDLPMDLPALIGTGLYHLERVQDGRSFRAQRVTDHYKDGSAGWVNTIEVVVIPDATVRAEALRDGYVDVVALPDPEGLRPGGTFLYHPDATEIALAAASTIGIPSRIAQNAPLDDGRIAERWWVV